MEQIGNTEKASNGMEIYEHDIYALADEYVETQLEEERRPKIYEPNGIFRAMIIYISKRIPKINNADINKLNDLFNIYISLCVKYDKLPTLELFAAFAQLNPATITSWINGEYRNTIYYDQNNNIINNISLWLKDNPKGVYRTESSSLHCQTVKKWKETCKNFLVDSLQNSRGTDANKIFVAKAAYGMVETAPVPVARQEQHRTPEQIAADYVGTAALPGEVTPDF